MIYELGERQQIVRSLTAPEAGTAEEVVARIAAARDAAERENKDMQLQLAVLAEERSDLEARLAEMEELLRVQAETYNSR